MKFLRTAWRPHPGQEPVLANDAGISICIGGVGWGKTQVAAAWLLRMIARHPRKKDGKRAARALILGKDFTNAAGTQFLAIRERVRELGLPEDAVIVDERGPGIDHKPELTFWNGVVASAYSGTDPDSTRSFEADLLWVDEAEEMSALALVTAIGRLRDVDAIRVMVTSNPKGGGWIYPMLAGDVPEWDEIRRANEVRFFRGATHQNPHSTKKTRQTMGALYRAVSPGLELQELGGRVLGTAEAPGAQAIEWVKAFVGKIAITSPADERAYVVSADLGRSEDFCWFTAASATGVVLAQDRSNLGEVDVTEDAYWPYVADRLIQFAVTWGSSVLVIDTARGGDQFAALLREALQRRELRVAVSGVDTSSVGKKSEILEALSMAIGMGRWTIPSAWESVARGTITVDHVEKLRLEFKKLIKTAHGARARYTHPKGGHDDGVVSHALAWSVLAVRPLQQQIDPEAQAQEERERPRGTWKIGRR